jgi:hypothetical protein
MRAAMSSTCRCKIAQCPHGLRQDLIIITIITCYSCPKRQGAAADKLLTKAAKIVILVGRARSKQDPINHGFFSMYTFPPPAGVSDIQPSKYVELVLFADAPAEAGSEGPEGLWRLLGVLAGGA